MRPNRKVWILLDDDRSLLDIVATLADLWDKDSIRLRSGTEAMAWLKDFQEGKYEGPPPELALLDIRMPGGPQGDEVARALRGTPGLQGVTIVMMTANFLDDDAEAHLLAATTADAFVRKPFPMLDDFKKVLDRAINKRISIQIKAAQGQPDPK